MVLVAIPALYGLLEPISVIQRYDSFVYLILDGVYYLT